MKKTKEMPLYLRGVDPLVRQRVKVMAAYYKTTTAGMIEKIVNAGWKSFIKNMK